MRILFEKRWQRWLLAFGLAAVASILEILFIDVKYQLIHVGMALACAVLAISTVVKVELKAGWTVAVELLFTAFCGVFLLHIAINGQPLVLGAFVYNMMLSMMFLLLLIALTGRVKPASLIWITFCWAFGLLDEIVYQFRGNQIVINDISALRTAVSVMGNYRIEFNTKIMISIITYLAAMVLYLRSSFGAWNRLSRIRMRLLCVVGAAVMLILPVAHLNRYRTYTWVKQGTQVPGILYEFMLELSDLNIDEPEGYSEEALLGLAEKYTEEPAGETDLPHVIVLMIESWADLNVLGDFETSREVTPFLDEFMQTRTTHGEMISSVYGGSTATSEWEFLTGNTMAFMPAGSMVYRQFVKDDIRSMVDVMNENGYACIAMHPYLSTGWDRNRIYPLLGFEESLFLEDMEWGGLVREYVSDDAFVDKVIEQFENRDPEKPLFVFGITMQNHGGYTDETFEPLVELEGLSTEFPEVEQYLSLLHLTDAAMEKLIAYFEDCGEDVVVMAFGDHHPRVPARFLEELNFPTEIQKRTVPYFIWKNYEDGQARELPLSSINYLGTNLMDEAGLDLPPYYRFLKEAQSVVPSINGMGVIEDGQVIGLSDVSPEQKEVLNKYHIFEYGAVFNWEIGDEIYTGAEPRTE